MKQKYRIIAISRDSSWDEKWGLVFEYNIYIKSSNITLVKTSIINKTFNSFTEAFEERESYYRAAGYKMPLNLQYGASAVSEYRINGYQK